MNYKHHHYQTIQAAGAIIEVPHHATVIQLFDNTLISSAPDTMKLVGGTTDYQVPSSKTFHPIRGVIWASLVGTVVNFYKGNTADATDTLKSILDYPTMITGGIEPQSHEYLFNEFTINAEKFLVIDPSNVQVRYITVTGYETDD